MIDMPHIRFGDESTGFEFPNTDGATDQVISTDGSDQLSWVNPVVGGGGGGGWTDDGGAVRLASSTDTVGIGTSSPHAVPWGARCR